MLAESLALGGLVPAGSGTAAVPGGGRGMPVATNVAVPGTNASGGMLLVERPTAPGGSPVVVMVPGAMPGGIVDVGGMARRPGPDLVTSALAFAADATGGGLVAGSSASGASVPGPPRRPDSRDRGSQEGGGRGGGGGGGGFLGANAGVLAAGFGTKSSDSKNPGGNRNETDTGGGGGGGSGGAPKGVDSPLDPGRKKADDAANFAARQASASVPADTGIFPKAPHPARDPLAASLTSRASPGADALENGVSPRMPGYVQSHTERMGFADQGGVSASGVADARSEPMKGGAIKDAMRSAGQAFVSPESGRVAAAMAGAKHEIPDMGRLPDWQIGGGAEASSGTGGGSGGSGTAGSARSGGPSLTVEHGDGTIETFEGASSAGTGQGSTGSTSARPESGRRPARTPAPGSFTRASDKTAPGGSATADPVPQPEPTTRGTVRSGTSDGRDRATAARGEATRSATPAASSSSASTVPPPPAPASRPARPAIGGFAVAPDSSKTNAEPGARGTTPPPAASGVQDPPAGEGTLTAFDASDDGSDVDGGDDGGAGMWPVAASVGAEPVPAAVGIPAPKPARVPDDPGADSTLVSGRVRGTPMPKQRTPRGDRLVAIDDGIAMDSQPGPSSPPEPAQAPDTAHASRWSRPALSPADVIARAPSRSVSATPGRSFVAGQRPGTLVSPTALSPVPSADGVARAWAAPRGGSQPPLDAAGRLVPIDALFSPRGSGGAKILRIADPNAAATAVLDIDEPEYDDDAASIAALPEDAEDSLESDPEAVTDPAPLPADSGMLGKQVTLDETMPRGSRKVDPTYQSIAAWGGNVARSAAATVIDIMPGHVSFPPNAARDAAREALHQQTADHVQAVIDAMHNEKGYHAARQLEREMERQFVNATYDAEVAAWKEGGKKGPKPKRSKSRKEARKLWKELRKKGKEPKKPPASPSGPPPSPPGGGGGGGSSQSSIAPDCPCPCERDEPIRGSWTDASGGTAGPTETGSTDVGGGKGKGQPESDFKGIVGRAPLVDDVRAVTEVAVSTMNAISEGSLRPPHIRVASSVVPGSGFFSPAEILMRGPADPRLPGAVPGGRLVPPVVGAPEENGGLPPPAPRPGPAADAAEKPRTKGDPTPDELLEELLDLYERLHGHRRDRLPREELRQAFAQLLLLIGEAAVRAKYFDAKAAAEKFAPSKAAYELHRDEAYLTRISAELEIQRLLGTPPGVVDADSVLLAAQFARSLDDRAAKLASDRETGDERKERAGRESRYRLDAFLETAAARAALHGPITGTSMHEGQRQRTPFASGPGAARGGAEPNPEIVDPEAREDERIADDWQAQFRGPSAALRQLYDNRPPSLRTAPEFSELYGQLTAGQKAAYVTVEALSILLSLGTSSLGTKAAGRVAGRAATGSMASRLAAQFASAATGRAARFAAGGSLAGALIDITAQYASASDGNFRVDWASVGTSAMIGAAVGAAVASVSLFGRLGGRASGRVVATDTLAAEAGEAGAAGWTRLAGRGIRIRRVGNYWIKEIDPEASALARWYGRGTIKAQAKGLKRLGDMAPDFLYREGKIITRHAGQFKGGVGDFLRTWAKGSWRLRTPFNDIRLRNIGEGGIIFDPSLHPLEQAALASSPALGYGAYKLAEGATDDD